MALNYYSYDQNNDQKNLQLEDDEDDYIDMEVSSFTHFFSPCKSSHNPREFEFQMTLGNMKDESTTSPADELFYKGKLLPLHLPPRLQMVENLLQDSSSMSHIEEYDEDYNTPLGTNTCITPPNVTPFHSCYVSRELNPQECLHDYKNHVCNNQKKSWTKKLKHKIKALFGKLGDFDGKNNHVDKKMKRSMKNPLRQVSSKENEDKDEKICHRKSFSGAFEYPSLPSSSSGSSSSSSSSSSSNNSHGLLDLLEDFRRSGGKKPENESSLIQAAIAHCKESRHALNENGFHSFSSCDDQTRTIGLCRG